MKSLTLKKQYGLTYQKYSSTILLRFLSLTYSDKEKHVGYQYRKQAHPIFKK